MNKTHPIGLTRESAPASATPSPEERTSFDAETLRSVRQRVAGLSGPDLVDWIRADQRDRWQRGEFMRLEAYLEALDSQTADEDTILDLIYCEHLLRNDHGIISSADSLARRFPKLDEKLRRLLALDDALATLAPSSDRNDTVSEVRRGTGKQRFDTTALAQVRQQISDLSGAELVHWVLTDQEKRWKLGETIPLEAYLEAMEASVDDDALMMELLRGESRLRAAHGLATSAESIARRFPKLEEKMRTVVRPRAAVDTQTRLESRPASRTHIGRYPILETYAEGGQAVVYRALHPTLRKEVIVKWSKEPADPAAFDSLDKEGRLLATLKHPHLGQVLDLDVCDGHLFLVLEYIPGQNLEQHRHRVTREPREWAAMLAKVARAVESIHAHGIVHLDLKPRNILVGTDGEPRVIDFGLAQFQSAFRTDVLRDGDVFGTLAFMAPEQACGDSHRIGPAADIFALGGTLYFLLTGKGPYADIANPTRIEPYCAGSWSRERLAKCEAPDELKHLAERALDVDLSQRPSAGEFAAELERFLQPMAPAPVARKSPHVMVGIAAVLLAALGLALWMSRPSPNEPNRSSAIPPPPLQPRPVTKIDVQVWRGDKGPFDLKNASPLFSGNEFRVRVPFSAPVHASLYFYSEGRWQKIAAITPADPPLLLFPSQPGKTQVLEGAPGAEFLLVTGRDHAAIEVADIERWLGNWAPLPDLPDQAYFNIDESGVHQTTRGVLGGTKDRENPADIVYQRLSDLRHRLRPHLAILSGVVFVHRTGDE